MKNTSRAENTYHTNYFSATANNNSSSSSSSSNNNNNRICIAWVCRMTSEALEMECSQYLVMILHQCWFTTALFSQWLYTMSSVMWRFIVCWGWAVWLTVMTCAIFWFTSSAVLQELIISEVIFGVQRNNNNKPVLNVWLHCMPPCTFVWVLNSLHVGDMWWCDPQRPAGCSLLWLARCCCEIGWLATLKGHYRLKKVGLVEFVPLPAYSFTQHFTCRLSAGPQSTGAPFTNAHTSGMNQEVDTLDTLVY